MGKLLNKLSAWWDTMKPPYPFSNLDPMTMKPYPKLNVRDMAAKGRTVTVYMPAGQFMKSTQVQELIKKINVEIAQGATFIATKTPDKMPETLPELEQGIQSALDQPAPIPNDTVAIWDLVIDDMRERHLVGVDRYGTPLQAFNGRNSLKDAYAEVLDLSVYLRQRIREDDLRVGTRLNVDRSQMLEMINAAVMNGQKIEVYSIGELAQMTIHPAEQAPQYTGSVKIEPAPGPTSDQVRKPVGSYSDVGS